MDYASTNSFGSKTEVTCDYCGAEIELHITKQKGHNDKEDYKCPECRKRHFIKAALPIQDKDIILKNKRTDGRSDFYKEN